jgi:transcriptional regulator with XRE-family HTH domain
MRFGDRVRELRKLQGLTQQRLAERLGVSLSYASKVETSRLNAGEYPSEGFVVRLAEALEADAYELLLLSNRVPEGILKRIQQRPEAFRAFAELDDDSMDRVLGTIKRIRS